MIMSDSRTGPAPFTEAERFRWPKADLKLLAKKRTQVKLMTNRVNSS